MKKALALAALLVTAYPLTVPADITASDLPDGALWYLHADLEKMRSTEAGQQLYGWMQDEVIMDINNEFSVDLNREVDRITAFSREGSGLIGIVEGRLSDELRQQVLRVAGEDRDLEQFEHRGRTYFLAGDETSATKINANEEIAHAAYFTFDVPGRLLIASSDDQMKSLIDNDGRVAGAGTSAGAMLVLSADKHFVQAGMRTADFADDGDGWDSNLLRNTEQAALMISDKDGMFSIVGKLIAKDPDVTQSLANILNGIIALQAFSGDMDPEISSLLRNTRVTASGNELSVSTVVAPETVVRTLSD